MSIFYRFFFAASLFISLIIVGVVYALEQYFHIQPCRLCIYQRMPYILMMVVASAGLLLPRYKNIICIVIWLISFSSFLLAGFHVAVEHNWIHYDSKCVLDNIVYSDSLEEFKKQIKLKDINSCNVVNFTLLKLSLATWNLIVSVAILVFTFFGVKSLVRK